MKRLWMVSGVRSLAILLLAAATAITAGAALLFAAPMPVLAAGDTVALSITNGGNLTYGGTPPNFTAVVTLGAAPTTSHTWSVTVVIAGGASFSNTSQPTKSADGLTLTFTGLHPANPVPAGAHSATATFTNPETSATVTSAPVSFSVKKAGQGMACAPANGATLLGAGKPINIKMATVSGNGSLPAEWLTGTFTVKLDGPTHTSYANLTATSAFLVTVTAPTQIGVYTLTCTFNGNANYASSTFYSSQPYTISSLHALGTVQLYSNPTTLATGQKIDFYVVFQPASGLPTPTGQFTLSFGNHHTSAFTLGSSGTFLIYFGTITSLGGVTDIQVFYMGDVNYNQATVHFPLTNQPIPSSVGDATPTAVPTGTVTTTETPGDETATPTAVESAGALTTTPADSGPNLGMILILAFVIMLLLAVVGGGAILLIYRARRGSADDEQGAYGSSAGYGYGRVGMYNQYDAQEPYRRSGVYRDAGQYGQYGQSGQYGRSGQYRQAGQAGPNGQTAQTARYPRPGQYGQNGLTGKHRQPGQYGASGQTGKYRRPDQFGQSGQYGRSDQTGRYRQYRDRGVSPDDDA